MITTLAKLSGNIVRPLLDFIYPPTCVSCGNLLSGEVEHVCLNCWDSIQRVTRTHALYLETKEKLLRSGHVAELASAFVFEKEGAFQHIAHSMKYEGMPSLGLQLGKRIGEVLQEWNLSADCVIPIPLHKRKLRERGYNQAELIARGVSETSGIEYRNDLVKRRKDTQSQTTLNIEERQENVAQAFEMIAGKSQDIKDKRIIVVDDVITTGATIVSCAHKLRTAGAASVMAVSAALAK